MSWEESLRRADAWPRLTIKAFDECWIFRLMLKLGWGMAAITIWNTIYMDRKLIGTEDGADILDHEMVHVVDQHTWNILFFLSYFLLPIGPSFKAIWEWRAYKKDLEDAHRRFGHVPEELRDFVARQFSSPGYFWMWPFGMRKRVDRYCDSLR